MKISSLSLTLLVLFASVATGFGGQNDKDRNAVMYTPIRISFKDLVDVVTTEEGGAQSRLSSSSSQILLEALQDVGMISITDIPHFDSTIPMMTSLPSCMDQALESGAIIAEQTFRDGTRRRSLATHTLDGEVAPIHNAISGSACESFDQESALFRENVRQVTTAFGHALSTIMNLSDPILFSDDGISYSFADVVEKGEHLEHFHCYDQASPSQVVHTEPQVRKVGSTIDWHLDQGLALIFTPGRINKQVTDGFYIRLADGSQVMVQFDSQVDQLVILLGDMIDQVVNPSIKGLFPLLRSVPHALAMPLMHESKQLSTRVWYGRMVLPPTNALHPVHQRTFGEIRNGMIEATINGEDNNNDQSDWLSLSCSSTQMRALHEAPASCLQDQYMCWHLCWNYTAKASPTVCAKQNLSLACVNDQRQLWAGDHNDAFHPGCVDLATAVNYTFTPTLAPSFAAGKTPTTGITPIAATPPTGSVPAPTASSPTSNKPKTSNTRSARHFVPGTLGAVIAYWVMWIMI